MNKLSILTMPLSFINLDSVYQDSVISQKSRLHSARNVNHKSRIVLYYTYSSKRYSEISYYIIIQGPTHCFPHSQHLPESHRVINLFSPNVEECLNGLQFYPARRAVVHADRDSVCVLRPRELESKTCITVTKCLLWGGPWIHKDGVCSR